MVLSLWLSPAAPCSEATFLHSSRAGLAMSESHGLFHLKSSVQRISLSSSVSSRMNKIVMMGNVNEGKGVFAPLVVITRNIVGKKQFNQLRGKAIALHSQVITEFCKSIGADAKQRQGLIRLAKKNGEKLGFLA